MLALACGLARAQPARAAGEGEAAPRFSLTTDQGRRVATSSFGGRLLVLNFWETACAPCVKELPSLDAFAHRFAPQGVVVLAISGDEDAAVYRRFLSDHRVTLDTYRDPERRIARAFGTTAFPETYLIQDGVVVRKVVGGIDWSSAAITAFVRARLARAAVVRPQTRSATPSR